MTQDPNFLESPPPELESYPDWVCLPCGLRHGHKHRVGKVACWNHTKCGVCGAETACTEPRDFGHLNITINGVVHGELL